MSKKVGQGEGMKEGHTWTHRGGRMKEPELSVERGAQVQLAQNPSPIRARISSEERKAAKGSQGTQGE